MTRLCDSLFLLCKSTGGTATLKPTRRHPWIIIQTKGNCYYKHSHAIAGTRSALVQSSHEEAARQKFSCCVCAWQSSVFSGCLQQKCFSGNPWLLLDLTWESFSLQRCGGFLRPVCCHIARQHVGCSLFLQSVCARCERGRRWSGRVFIPSWYCINLKGRQAVISDSSDTENTDQRRDLPPPLAPAGRKGFCDQPSPWKQE